MILSLEAFMNDTHLAWVSTTLLSVGDELPCVICEFYSGIL